MKHKAGRNGGGGGSSASTKSGKGGSASASASRGKGKGKERTTGSASASSAVDLSVLPLSLPQLGGGEETDTALQRYHAVLQRDDANGVGLDDVDALQLELEALLAATVVKRSAVREEVSVIRDADKYAKQGGKDSGRRVRDIDIFI